MNGDGQQPLARMGQRHGVVHALEQGRVQFFFQLLDLKGDRGLREAQLPGRAGEAFQFVDHDEGFQVFHIHRRTAYLKN